MLGKSFFCLVGNLRKKYILGPLEQFQAACVRCNTVNTIVIRPWWRKVTSGQVGLVIKSSSALMRLETSGLTSQSSGFLIQKMERKKHIVLEGC